jgi:hypothetical protein
MKATVWHMMAAWLHKPFINQQLKIEFLTSGLSYFRNEYYQ